MAYTEKTTTGYGTRVGNSLKATLMGFVIIIGATILLWWNEGRAVKTADMLEDAQGACVEMPNPDKKSAEFEGELVCATAMANTKQETTTTYTYKQEWVSSPVNSADFKDPAYQGKNYTWTTVEDQDVWAEKVTFGAYVLNESLIHSISSTEPIELDVNFQTLQSMNKSVADTYARIKGNTAVIADAVTNLADTTETATNGNQVDLDFVHQAGNVIYYGRTANAPEVGDVRITFEKTVPAKVTVVSVVEGNTFKPFVASNKKKFQTLRMGKKSINTMWTWILRIVGILLVISGFKSLFSFLETLLKVVPFLSSIFAFGVGIICTIVGIVYSLIVIALAWIFYRPVLGIILLVIAGFLVWVFAFNGKKKLAELANKGKGQPAAAPAE